jgi:hypothetical protein
MEIKYQKDFTEDFLRMFISNEWVDIFELTAIKEKKKEWHFVLTEKKEKVPAELKNKIWVLNGYCKPIELMTHPVGGKAVYIKIRRRRWKEEGQRTSHENYYDLHYPGVKTTKEFADFLKEFNREQLAEFFSAWPMYRRVWEKDTSLVQRFLKRFQRRG